MKKLIILLLVSLGLLFVGCASQPPAEEPEEEVEVVGEVYPPKVLEHKTSAFDGSVPEWVFLDATELERTEQYEDSYVFVFDTMGESLDGVKAWASGFEAPKEVARMVSTRVKNKFVGAQVGDKDMVESYMEEVVKLLAEAQYSGARKGGDFWVYQQYFDEAGNPDKRQYRYLYLYIVPKQQVDDAIDRALEAQNSKAKPKTEEEKVARDRVKQLFDEEGM
jgi:hypothetical protein